tara:strand:+ start:170 stop:706 length:537 start_codon:yes stop_codon:yes gene_type:complete
MKTLQDYEKNHQKELSSGKSFPNFSSGDTLKVHLKVKEGEKERIQIFEGVCISVKNSGLNSSFTVRKISYGEGIERILPLYSPQISKIELIKSGDVRRSKLYYLRNRSGKSARISEKGIFKTGEDVTEKNILESDKNVESNQENENVLSEKIEKKNSNDNPKKNDSKKNEKIIGDEKK